MTLKYKITTILVILAIVGFLYLTYTNHSRKTFQFEEPASPSDEDMLGVGLATSTDTVNATSTKPFLLTASTTLDRNSWKTYTNSQSGYSLQHPKDFILTRNDQNFSASLPKNVYFHWPLQDDVKITATSSCSGGKMDLAHTVATSTIEKDGIILVRAKKYDIAAGNRYQETTYQVRKAGKNNPCIELSMYFHGANGAGLYVDNVSLVKKYNEAHDIEFQAMETIFDNMVDSLKL